jgi:hypothetical protein
MGIVVSISSNIHVASISQTTEYKMLVLEMEDALDVAIIV